MLIAMGDMLKEAQKSNYAVPAPNVWNEDSVRAVLTAAEECNSPVILDCSYMESRFGAKAGQVMYEQMLYTIPWARETSVPVAINLDHGEKYVHAITAVRAGFTSIMVDRSSLPFEENVKQVKELVKVAHAVGVSVEAELGHVGDASNYDRDGSSNLTDPDQAKQYAKLTGIDCLAIAIGTAHGAYSSKPYIDFDRLTEIRKKVNIPLVLHGGSGTGDENLQRAARNGICKVNLYTDLVTAGIEEIRQLDLGGIHDFHYVEKLAYRGYRNKLLHYMKLLGSAGQAKI